MKIKTKIVSSHTAEYKPVKQEVNGTVILPPFSISWFKHGLMGGSSVVQQSAGYTKFELSSPSCQGRKELTINGE